MNIDTILAGGFLGAMIQQVFVMVNNSQAFKRDKSKALYQNKLTNGERLVGLYIGASFHVRTVITTFNTVKKMVNDEDMDLDYDGIEVSLTTSMTKLAECEDKIVTEGAKAYLYYNIDNTWTDIDFTEYFNLTHSLAPKVNRLNELSLNDENSPTHLAIKAEVNSDLDKLIISLNKYKLAVDSTVSQIKLQAKS